MLKLIENIIFSFKTGNQFRFASKLAFVFLGLLVFVYPAHSIQSSDNPPANLNCEAVNGIVSLTWSPPLTGDFTDPTGYRIYRASVTGGPYQQVGALSPQNGINGQPILFRDQPGPGPWFYVITAYNLNPSVESLSSNECEIPAASLPTPTFTLTPTFTPTPSGSLDRFHKSGPVNTPTNTPTNTSIGTLTFTVTPTPTPITCLQYSLSFSLPNNNFVNGSAMDANGNLYLSQNDINVISSNGIPQTEWGGSILSYPAGIAIAQGGNGPGTIYVVDNGLNVVDAFNIQGRFLFNFSTLSNGAQLNNPNGIALDSSGNVYVSDSGDNLVAKFSPSGNPVTTFGTSFLTDPQGIAVDTSGNIFVGDSGNCRIVKMDLSGNFLTSFNASGTLGDPVEMKINNKGLLWVADAYSGLVMSFDDYGNLLNSFNGTNIGGTLFDEVLVSLDPSGCMYVPDSFSGVVQKFCVCAPTAPPNCCTVLQTLPTPPGGFGYPRGLTTDLVNHLLYIADTGNNVIQAYSTASNPWSWQVSIGSGFLSTPEDVALGPDGSLFVADYGNGRVVKFTKSGTVWSAAATIGQNLVGGCPGVFVDSGGAVFVSSAYSIFKFNGSGSSYSCSATFGSPYLYIPVGLLKVGNQLYVANGVISNVLDFTENVSGGVTSYSNPTTVIFPGWNPGQVANPTAVKTDLAGNFYVSEGHPIVSAFDPYFNYQWQCQTSTNSPIFVALNELGNLAVAQGNGNNVEVLQGCAVEPTLTPSFTFTPTITPTYTPTLTPTSTNTGTPTNTPNSCTVLQTLPTPSGGFNYPRGLTDDLANHLLYIADTGNNKIQVYSTVSWTWQLSIGGSSQLNTPEDVALGPDGSLFVADYGNGRVVKFSKSGGAWSAAATMGQNLVGGCPGVYADSGGAVFVSSSSNIFKFNGSGSSYSCSATFGSPYLNIPVGITKMGSQVYVANSVISNVLDFPENISGGVTTYGTPTTVLFPGWNPGQVADPNGIKTDLAGNFYVSEVNPFVSAFNPNFNFQWQCQLPYNSIFVALNEFGNLSTSEGGNQVQVLRGSGIEPTLTPTITDTPLASQVCKQYSNQFPSFNSNFINGSALVSNSSVTNLYLTQNDVDVLNSQGVSQNEFGGVTLQYPLGIAVTAASSSGTIYVVDSGANTVDAFDLSGTLKFQFGTLPSGANGVSVNSPTGIALDSSGNVYVADTDNGQVDVFDKTGSPTTVVGTGLLDSPEGVAVDGNGNIYVGDGGLAQIVKFNSSGIWQTSFNAGTTLGEPYEMKFDSSTTLLWVADPEYGQVLVFDTDGDVLGNFNGTNIGGMAFNMPLVSPGANGDIYIPDTASVTIQKFSVCAATPTFTNSPTFTPTPTFTQTYTPTYTPSPTFTITKTPQLSLRACLHFTATVEAASTPAGSFINGSAVDTDPSNNLLYLTTNDVVAYYPSGAKQNEFGSGILQNPLGVAVTSASGAGTIYVVDNGNEWVQAFNIQATPVFHSGNLPNGLSMTDPTGIALDSTGNFYVTDSGDNQVVKFSATGTASTTFGSNILDDPQGIAVDGSGNVFVGDWGNYRVVKFNSSGTFQYSFNANGNLDDPYEIKVTNSGGATLVWVADSVNSQLFVFDTYGNVLNSFSGPDIGGNPFDSIMVSLDSSYVYVPDTYTSTYQQFSICAATYTPTNTNTGSPTFTPTKTFTNTPTPLNTNTPTPTGIVTCYQAALTIGGFDNGIYDVAVDPYLGDIYAADNSATVFVYTPTGAAVATIPLSSGSGPSGLDWGRAANLIYLANNSAPDVQLISAPWAPTPDTVAQTIGNSTWFSAPSKIAVDVSGNMYVTDKSGNQVLKFNSGASSPQTLIPSSAGVTSPTGIGLDSSGNIYIAGSSASSIFVFSPGGSVSATFNGSGATTLSNPQGLRVDQNGRVFVADSGNNRVEVFSYNGTSWVYSFGVTTGLNNPRGLFLDNSNNLFVADTGHNQIVKFEPCGFATPTKTPTPVSTACLSLSFNWNVLGFQAIALDVARGNIYVSAKPNGTDYEIEEVNQAGNVIRQWGSTGNRPGQFSNVPYLLFDNEAQELYAVDQGNSRVQVFERDGTFKRSFGGYGTGQGKLNSPMCLVIDGKGNVYVSDGSVVNQQSAGNMGSGNNRIVEFTTAGAFVQSFGASDLHYLDPDANQENTWVDPRFLAYGPDGNLYISQNQNWLLVVNPNTHNVVRKQVLGGSAIASETFDLFGRLWAYSGGSVTIFDSKGNQQGLPLSLQTSVAEMVFDASGDLYTANNGSGSDHGIFKYIPCGTLTPTPTFTFTPTPTSTPSPCFAAALTITQNIINASGVAIDSYTGNVYESDIDNAISPVTVRINEFSSNGVFIRSWGSVGRGNGQFITPYELAIDNDGREIYSADTGNNRVEVFDLEGNFHRNIGGYGIDPGLMRKPAGIAFDGNGNVFIADQGNARIDEFTTQGEYEKSIGTTINGVTMVTPSNITIGKDGYLYVIDPGASGSPQMDVFNPTSGAFVRSWNESGMAPPIATDNNGLIWTGYNSALQAWTTFGSLVVSSWNPIGNSFNKIAFDPAGDLFAAPAVSNQFIKYVPCGAYTPTPTPTGSFTWTPTKTYTPSITPTPTFTPTGTATNTPTGSFTYTPIPTVCETFASIVESNSNHPDGVEVDPKTGNLYVAEYDGGTTARIYSPNGGFLTYFQSGGPTIINSGQLALDPVNGLIYLADLGNSSNNGQVVAYTLAGKFARIMVSGINKPRGIAVDTAGQNIYVADSGNNRILKIKNDGTLVGIIGKGSSSLPGQWNNPEGIAFGPDGNIYVADSGNNRVQVFNPNGQFVRLWTPQGGASLNQPVQLRFDGQGLLWELDSGSNQIQVFDGVGNKLTQYLGYGGGFGQVSENDGSAYLGSFVFNLDGGFYVADLFNNRVQRIAPCNLLPTPTPSLVFSATPCLAFSYQWTVVPSPVGVAVYADGTINSRLYVANSTGVTIYLPNSPSPTFTPTNTFTNTNTPTPTNTLPAGTNTYTPLPTNTFTYTLTPTQTPTVILPPIVQFRPTVPSGDSHPSISGVMVDPVAKEVYLADQTAGGYAAELSVFDLNGNFKRFIGKNQITAPQGMALDGKGYVYVSDYNSFNGYALNRILKFSTSGDLKWIIGTKGSQSGMLYLPSALTVGPDGNLYVAENGNQRISVFNPNGSFIRVFGAPTPGPGLFSNQINTLQFDSNNHLWVADAGNNRVEVMDSYGNTLEAIGVAGGSPGQFGNPSIALAADGGFYEADNGNARLQRFEPCSFFSPTPTPALTPTQTPTPIPGSYMLRIDAGSIQSYNDQSSNLWLQDQPSSAGVSYWYGGGQAYTSSRAVSGTTNPGLYQSYRAGAAVTYVFNLPSGHYLATMKFADFISPGPGQNVMNIQVAGETVATRLDIFSAVGGAYATDRSFREDVTPSSGPLTIQLNAYTGQAFISGIEIQGLQSGNPLINYYFLPGGGALLP